MDAWMAIILGIVAIMAVQQFSATSCFVIIITLQATNNKLLVVRLFSTLVVNSNNYFGTSYLLLTSSRSIGAMLDSAEWSRKINAKEKMKEKSSHCDDVSLRKANNGHELAPSRQRLYALPLTCVGVCYYVLVVEISYLTWCWTWRWCH